MTWRYLILINSHVRCSICSSIAMAQNPVEKKQKQSDVRPWIVLAVAVVLFVIGAVFKFFPIADETARSWSFNILTKVGIVLLTVALAWTQLKFLVGSTYGRILVCGMAVTAIFFIIRPRAVFGLLPLIAAGVALMGTITFLRDMFLSPRKK